jgi:hypothetical protein
MGLTECLGFVQPAARIADPESFGEYALSGSLSLSKLRHCGRRGAS